MATMDVFPFQGKTHVVEPGIEPGTSRLVVRNSDHQATRLVKLQQIKVMEILSPCQKFKYTVLELIGFVIN